MLILLPLILMPVLMILALTLRFLLDALDAIACAVVDDANADAEMPNGARYLAGAYVVFLQTPLLPMLLLRTCCELMLVMM